MKPSVNYCIYVVFFLNKVFNDSGLVAWHTFDGGSYNDSSGHSLNAMAIVDVMSVSGRINQAISFYSNSSLYKVFVKSILLTQKLQQQPFFSTCASNL